MLLSQARFYSFSSSFIFLFVAAVVAACVCGLGVKRMFQRKPLLARQAVAFFNMKHFRSKHKVPITPENIKDVFTRQLEPQDRLLRHSQVGSGSTRMLVLDRQQQVKGVYHPVLCLPHPATVYGGDNVLGLSISDYLAALEAKVPADAAHGTTPQLPTVLTIVSHPNGLALGTYAADGAVRMPLRNLVLPPASTGGSGGAGTSGAGDTAAAAKHGGTGLGEAAAKVSASSATGPSGAIDELVKVINANYAAYIASCSTFYFVTRDTSASLTLAALQKHEQELKEQPGAASTAKCALSFLDRRWVALPDAVLQFGHDVALYTRDAATKQRIVSPPKLHATVMQGLLDLDRAPRTEEGPAASPP